MERGFNCLDYLIHKSYYTINKFSLCSGAVASAVSSGAGSRAQVSSWFCFMLFNFGKI